MWHLNHPPEKRDAEAELRENELNPEDGDDSDDSDEEQESESEEEETPACRHKGKKAPKTKKRRPGDDVMGFQPKPVTPSRLLGLTDEGPCIPLVGSSKLAAVKETVLRWQAEAPEDKILSKCPRTYSLTLLEPVIVLTVQFLSNTRSSLSASLGCSRRRESNSARTLATPSPRPETRPLRDSRQTPSASIGAPPAARSD